MKNLKKVSLGLAALVVAFGLVFSMSAFRNHQNKVIKTSSYWQFTGDDITQVRDYTKYVKITNPEAPSCEEGSDIPCVLATPEAVNSPELLEEHLLDDDNFINDQAVLDASMYKREAPTR
ncbi:MAG: hypothetical protein EOO87_16090 [Pedobacter sp.]|nr:MAG: hypothetical protein EOO87_16090 [Pedobacter sp.]